MERWLLVGALWSEVSPVLARMRARRWLGPRLATGVLGGAEIALLRSGVGPARAKARTAAALERWDATRVLSFGTSGALTADHALGAVLTGHRAATEQGPPRALSPLPGVPAVAIASVRHVVCTPTRRDALAAAGFDICEMECVGVLEAAGGRPVHALKVVSDRAGADADPALPGSGIPSPGRLLRSQLRAAALVHGRLLPALEGCLRLRFEPT